MRPPRPILLPLTLLLLATSMSSAQEPAFQPRTKVAIVDGAWRINGVPTYRGSPAEGLLMNVRMVNAIFEDRRKPEFDPEANTDRFLEHVPNYHENGVRAFTLCLQGGTPGYEGAINSAFEPDGSLRPGYLKRVERVIAACDRAGIVVILGCFYQRQDQILKDDAAVRAAVANVARWIRTHGYTNVLLEIANEYNHGGFNHRIIRSVEGEVELIGIAKREAPGLLVSVSGLGDGKMDEPIAQACDYILIHFNGTPVSEISKRVAAFARFKKPVVCNEDQKLGTEAAQAAERSVHAHASWGFMHEKVNQHLPFRFEGAKDDPIVYAKLKELTSAHQTPTGVYFPPPESQGGWRKLTDPKAIRSVAGMDPKKLAELETWLRQSDQRDFAAVVIRRGYIVLEVERGNSAVNDSRRVASCSKAVCATVLAIASEESQSGKLPRKMSFDDPAFDFIPQAQPLSDPRKAKITVRQLLNHTSGLCPESIGAPNDGSWEYVLGHSGDPRTANLAFDPGTACGYSTHAFAHASLVCETVTGKPYDVYAVDALFKPLGIEHWWFQFYNGDAKHGRHPSHGLGMPARDMARIGYCLAHEGRWNDRQVVPRWFVEQSGHPSHSVTSDELRFKINAQSFSLGWELPGIRKEAGVAVGQGIPIDARFKPGSGGQLIGFVPSLDLVLTRQTGSSGGWDYVEFMRRACGCVIGD